EEGVHVGGELGVVLEEEAVRGVRVEGEAGVRKKGGQGGGGGGGGRGGGVGGGRGGGGGGGGPGRREGGGGGGPRGRGGVPGRGGGRGGGDARRGFRRKRRPAASGPALSFVAGGAKKTERYPPGLVSGCPTARMPPGAQPSTPAAPFGAAEARTRRRRASGRTR